MSMHTTNTWHQNSLENMVQAQQAHRKAHSQNGASQKAHEETTMENLCMYGEVSGTLRQKVQSSQRLIAALQKRATSLEASVRQQQESVGHLEETQKALEPPLRLCLQRMEQRERRPLREQVRDNPEVALEAEKSALLEAQRRLVEAVRRTRATVADLEGRLLQVREDLEQKAQALSIDEACLRTTERSHQAVLEFVQTTPKSARSSQLSPSSPAQVGGSPLRSLSPRSPGALALGRSKKGPAAQLSLQESSRNELQRKQEAVRLGQAAAACEEAAKTQREENRLLSARCHKATLDARAKSEQALQERISENQQMRKRLEAEIRETSDKIEHTKATILETRAQIKALQEPMELTSTCSSFRKQRATREHINDPVTTKIAEHQMVVVRARDQLVGHHQVEKGNLQELNERKERLRDDIRDKTAALHIDLDCLSHEAAHTNGKATTYLSKNKLSRALKIDSSFVPAPAPGTALVPMSAR